MSHAKSLGSRAAMPRSSRVDVQNDFCPWRRARRRGRRRRHSRVDQPHRRPLCRVRVFTQDWHPADHLSFADQHPGAAPFSMTEMPYGPQVLWPVHCVQGHPRCRLPPRSRTSTPADLDHPQGDAPREVDSYSAFFENDHTTPTGLRGLPARTRGWRSLWLAGLATDFCVGYLRAATPPASASASHVDRGCLPRHRPRRLARRA